MATKKAGGSTRLGRDSNPQYLGAKVGDGETVKTGMILVRQRGTKMNPGKNVKRASDDSLYAMVDGVVKFTRKRRRRFDGSLKPARFVNVIPNETK
jgi:large subunit ribosomal protein L27